MIFPIEIIESDYFSGKSGLSCLASLQWAYIYCSNIYNGIERDNDEEFIHMFFVFFLLLRNFKLFVKVKHKYFLTAVGFFVAHCYCNVMWYWFACLIDCPLFVKSLYPFHSLLWISYPRATYNNIWCICMRFETSKIKTISNPILRDCNGFRLISVSNLGDRRKWNASRVVSAWL